MGLLWAFVSSSVNTRKVRTFVFRVTVWFQQDNACEVPCTATGPGTSTPKPSRLLPYLSFQACPGADGGPCPAGARSERVFVCKRPETSERKPKSVSTSVCCHQLAVSAKAQKVRQVCEGLQPRRPILPSPCYTFYCHCSR